VEAGAAVSGASERPLVEWGDRAAAGERGELVERAAVSRASERPLVERGQLVERPLVERGRPLMEW
jgi:hypothetical protein